VLLRLLVLMMTAFRQIAARRWRQKRPLTSVGRPARQRHRPLPRGRRRKAVAVECVELLVERERVEVRALDVAGAGVLHAGGDAVLLEGVGGAWGGGGPRGTMHRMFSRSANRGVE
jgi:hypothetical protein